MEAKKICKLMTLAAPMAVKAAKKLVQGVANKVRRHCRGVCGLPVWCSAGVVCVGRGERAKRLAPVTPPRYCLRLHASALTPPSTLCSQSTRS